MNLDKLSIFAKDTDGTAPQRGFEFQKLRTLEAWLQIYLEKSNAVIYCDYEDDIFQRNMDRYTSQFIQLKLYSSKNFSFASSEVRKAISHFFMLFVKGEYKFDEVEFVFETNASVAKKHGDNASELLQQWKDQQGTMPQELLAKCTQQVQSVVRDYLSQAIGTTKDEALQKEMKDLAAGLDLLPPTVWEDFVKAIHWQFSEISAEKAIEDTIEAIYGAISQTGFPAVDAEKENIFSRLYYTVSDRSIRTEPLERKIDASLLDEILVQSGDEADKAYQQDYKVWQNFTTLKHFRFAEFSQAINAATHCRLSSHLAHHSEFWLDILHAYITFEQTPLRYRQKAIYEYLWLALRPKMLGDSAGTLIGKEALVATYFTNIKSFHDHLALLDAAALLGMVQGSAAMGKLEVGRKDISRWQQHLQNQTNIGLAAARNEDEKCYFLEIAAHLLLQQVTSDAREQSFNHFQQIIRLLERASFYDVRRLYRRINEFIKIMIELEEDVQDIERMENVADELMPFVARKNNATEMAKVYIERGSKYLTATNRLSVLRALENFHAAKTCLRDDQGKPGYVLALLSIAQLHTRMGNNLAGKYYALVAARHAENREELHYRVPDAFSLLHLADFQQGAWLSCLLDFRAYINSRGEYRSLELDDQEEDVAECLDCFACILALSTRLSPQTHGIIAYEISKMQTFYPEFLEASVRYLEDKYGETDMQQRIPVELDDYPLSDLGPVRAIRWKALGIDWKITFPNDYITTSVAEEFTAMLQILVTELGLSTVDLHLIQSSVEIKIATAESWLPPQREPGNILSIWTVSLPVVMREDRVAIKMQVAGMITSLKFILDELSLLPTDQLYAEVQELFIKRDLAGKTLPDYLYQRMYRNFISEEVFNNARRSAFQPVTFSYQLVQHGPLTWNNAISPKYSRERSLELIRGRYKGALSVIYLTLENIKKDSRYPLFISQLRQAGWLDWQIVMAMANHVIDYKVHMSLEGEEFLSSDQQDHRIKSELSRLYKVDEKDNFIRFALDYFIDPSFTGQLQRVGWICLHNWQLENNSGFPNFNAINNLLNERFNFNVDDDPSLSPL